MTLSHVPVRKNCPLPFLHAAWAATTSTVGVRNMLRSGVCNVGRNR